MVLTRSHGFFLLLLLPSPALAQEGENAVLRQEVTELRALVEKLAARVDELERRAPPASAGPAAMAAALSLAPSVAAPAPPPAQSAAAPAAAQSAPVTGARLLGGTTVNFMLDTFYNYNFNSPIGRVNRLRAYDVTSNSFSLNQAAVVLENAPDPDHGKRFGGRLDLQWGEATETLQGSPANEPRPEIYRAIFQAYGTYVVPIGGGLTADFGKWASSLGIEGNYTKDQMNYSRSYWFNYLPFYHMGLRLSYPVNKALTLHYWVVNGTNWTEGFNGFKDQSFGLAYEPHKNFTWTVNYYLGQEHPDVVFYPNGGAPAGAPTEQGVPFEPLVDSPKGRLHIFDSYATWQASPKLSLALEGDWVIQRLYPWSAPQHTEGGAFYAQYRLTNKIAFAARTEYLSDTGGLFSGTAQALKEGTLTADYKFGEGFLMRGEWRRDFSNVPYFYTDTLNILARHQTTATLGLVWWFGGKEGAW